MADWVGLSRCTRKMVKANAIVNHHNVNNDQQTEDTFYLFFFIWEIWEFNNRILALNKFIDFRYFIGWEKKCFLFIHLNGSINCKQKCLGAEQKKWLKKNENQKFRVAEQAKRITVQNERKLKIFFSFYQFSIVRTDQRNHYYELMETSDWINQFVGEEIKKKIQNSGAQFWIYSPFLWI